MAHEVVDMDSKQLYNEAAREMKGSGDDELSTAYLNTTQDTRDMKRMGKVQEMRVEKLSKDIQFLLRLHDYLHLGIPLAVKRALVVISFLVTSTLTISQREFQRPSRRRQARVFLHLPLDGPRNGYGDGLAGGNGVDGTYGRWALSLGVRVHTEKIPARPVLRLRLVDKPSLAGVDRIRLHALSEHLCLIAIANIVFINVFNVYGAWLVAPLQNPSMLLHVFTLIAVLTVLWTLAPHPSAHDVFLEFENTGGWQSTGLALCVGQISALFGLICGDAAAHISEEVKDAGRTVPRSIFWGFFVNAILGLVFVITFLFAIPSVSDALADPTGYPFLYVFQQCIPNGGTAALTAAILILVTVCNISFNAATARQTFAFARDRGLPFSRIIGHIDKRLMIPANAVWTTMAISTLLNLIILGSSAAFNALMSLQLVALMATYALSLSIMLWRRLDSPEKLPPCPWSLGRAGPFINLGGIAYCTFSFFFCFWPVATGFDVTTFNWAPAMFVGVTVLSIALYLLRGRKVYDGPVITVEGFLVERRLEGFDVTHQGV